MDLSADAVVRLRASHSVDAGLRHVVPETLESHMWFDPAMLDLPEFWSAISEDLEIPDGMRLAFADKDPIRFQPYLDDFQERLYEWFSGHFDTFLERIP